jgi:multidrug transporter EmrE-like cation transporter
MYGQQQYVLQPVSGSSQQAQVVILSSAVTDVIPAYNHKLSKVFSSCLIALGCLSILWNVLLIFNGFGFAPIGYGIWSGIMIIISGSLGISVGEQRSRCKIIAFMVLCIITTTVCLVSFLIGTLGTVMCPNTSRYSMNCSKYDAVLNGLLAATVGLGAILAICGSALGCKATCCNSQPTEVGVPLMMYGTQQVTCIAPPVNAAGVYQYSVMPTQPLLPAQQPLQQQMTPSAPPDNRAPPVYGADQATPYVNANQPLMPPAYSPREYGADALPQKC